MDYKEQMLADFENELIQSREEYSRGVPKYLLNALEKILATLPSEEEIAKGLWTEYEHTTYYERDVDGLSGYIFPDWLDQQEGE